LSWDSREVPPPTRVPVVVRDRCERVQATNSATRPLPTDWAVVRVEEFSGCGDWHLCSTCVLEVLGRVLR
jgi:hypothetical protein